jgi:phosphoserine aminotransferase
VVNKASQAQENNPILSRAKQVEVDYANIPSLTQILNEHKIHTIISAISLYGEEDSEAQLNLIWAAEDAAETRRFIPSEYSFIQTVEYVRALSAASLPICMDL